jgi:two-component system NtrC family sensor kinase
MALPPAAADEDPPMQFKNLSLRTKLAFNLIMVVITVGLASSLVGIRMLANEVIKGAQLKVQIDLNSAWMVYQERLKDIESLVRFTSERFFLKDCIAAHDLGGIRQELERVRIENNLDMLTLTDRSGKVLLRSREPYFSGDDQSNDEIVAVALREKRLVSATEIMSREELVKEGTELVDKACMVFVPTSKEKPRVKDQETSGMVLKVAVPVFDTDKKILGILYGAHLLNRDYSIVDRMKDIVYKGIKYKGKELGSATIFQWDVRISTNVKTAEGLRAIGTRASSEVYEKVLESGQPFMGRAYVVNVNYITAYEPIKNIRDEIIGMLSVGILVAPFTDKRNELVVGFFAVALLGVVMALLTVVFVTSRITRPLATLGMATEKIALGDLVYEVPVESDDELGRLASAFNKMTRALSASKEELLRRSEDLENANRSLRNAQAKLIQTEKLSSLGQLAAGVAHELNNPLTGIMTFSHLLRKTISDEAALNDLDIIIRETTRCKEIIKGILDFSRETSPQHKLCSVNAIISRTLAILERQWLFHNIRIEKQLDEQLPEIWIDDNQIQQVFMNIALNAAEAMSGEGTLSLISRFSREDDYIEVHVADTGNGIPPEYLTKIFDPFFTTKGPQKGTGLGLAISYGIIQKHQGDISVESSVGKGTTFIIKLPFKPQETATQSS